MPNRRKYSDEFKLKVVEEYQSGVVSNIHQERLPVKPVATEGGAERWLYWRPMLV